MTWGIFTQPLHPQELTFYLLPAALAGQTPPGWVNPSLAGLKPIQTWHRQGHPAGPTNGNFKGNTMTILTLNRILKGIP